MGREVELRTDRLLLRSHARSRRVMEKLGMTYDGGDEREVFYRLRR